MENIINWILHQNISSNLSNKTHHQIEKISISHRSFKFCGEIFLNFQEKKTLKFESGKKSSVLEYYWRPPLIGDPHGRLDGDPQILMKTPRFSFETPYFRWRSPYFIGEPQIFIEDPYIYVADSHFFVGDPRFSLETSIFAWGSRNFSFLAVFNEFLGLSNENMRSSMNLWDLQ